jgi:thiol-disulfide isomerase/thioredoxin
MKKTIIIACALAFVLAQGQVHAKPAPKFALFNADGKLITLSSLVQKGNVILSFWASYCKPCKKEMPQLVEIEKKYGPSKNVSLILINIDKEGKEAGIPVLEDLGVSSVCLYDMYQVTAKNYVPGLKIPALYLISKKGEIVFEAIGESAENIQNLEKAINRLK